MVMKCLLVLLSVLVLIIKASLAWVNSVCIYNTILLWYCGIVIHGYCYFRVQVAYSEWFLGVQIQHFENKYNSEIRDGKYCCCDNGDVKCGKNITDLQGMCDYSKSAYGCEPYFLIHVRDCPYNSNYCSVNKTYQMNNERTSLDQLVLYVPFRKSELSNQVRIVLINVLRSYEHDEFWKSYFKILK